MHSSLLIAALWLAVTATAQPCLSADFSLAMSLGVGPDDTQIYLSLNAINSSNAGELFLVGEKLAPQYPGTPVSLNGTSGNASLTLQIDAQNSACHTLSPGSYDISVPDVGELYGAAFPAFAVKGQSWPHFFYGNGTGTQGEIQPMRTAADQLWLACDSYIDGLNYLQLKWGLYYNNGSAPTGCRPTNVVRFYNIPCSDA